MKLSIGIVGLPNVGKSTLFKLLTNNDVHIANYPFATIDPNVGVVSVPDERLKALTNLSHSAKEIPAVVEFYDIAGLVKGASSGEGLGNQFLSHIKETQALVQVVRCFKKEEIIHVDTSVDPIRDITTINTELILKDLETVQRRMNKLEGEARTGDKKKVKELEFVKRVHDALNKEQLASALEESVLHEDVVREMNLITAKKQIYLLNGSREEMDPNFLAFLDSIGSAYVIEDLGGSPSLDELVQKAYETLNLISFFTTGEDETRAWTIVRGEKAPQAAGAIHSDFEKKFIRAEVIFWKDLIDCGGWIQAKQKGKLRLEGKEYVVTDGDVMEIRHG